MEALIGVLIGAVIGYVAAITTLVVEHRRWMKDKKLEYLRAERRHKEEQYLHILSNLNTFVDEDCHDKTTVSRTCLVLSDEIAEQIDSNLEKLFNKEIDRHEVFGQIAFYMRKSLDEIDKEIKELI